MTLTMSRKRLAAGDKVRSLSRTIVGVARRIGVSLHPAIIDQLGIIATISWYCREYRKIYSGVRLEQRITATEAEIRTNPRARSARLRVAERLRRNDCQQDDVEVEENRPVVDVIEVVLDTLLSAGYLLPIVHRAFLRPAAAAGATHGEAPATMVVALVATAALTVAILVFPDVPLALARGLVAR